MLPVLRMGVQGPLHQDKSINMQQLQVTIIIQANLFTFLFWTVFSY